MKPDIEKSVNLVIEAVKQELNLASAIIAASAIVSGNENYTLEGFKLSLGFLFTSILAGIFTLLTLAFAIGRSSNQTQIRCSSNQTQEYNPLNQNPVRISGSLQSILFLIGIFMLAISI